MAPRTTVVRLQLRLGVQLSSGSEPYRSTISQFFNLVADKVDLHDEARLLQDTVYLVECGCVFATWLLAVLFQSQPCPVASGRLSELSSPVVRCLLIVCR